MGTRENKVELHLAEQVGLQLGGICRKWISPGNDGVPDQLVFIPEDIRPKKIVLVEVKTIDGVLEDNQIREQKRLIEAGAEVCTVFGHQGVTRFIMLYKQDFIFNGERIL